MDELKNLVIQTLETNGILGQLRAQLRSCVFKVIDNQDQIEKGQSSFHWENPNAKKAIQNASGILCAELIRDYMEFYKLDYSLSIFMPEVNLNQQQAMSKEELCKKVGLSEVPQQKPLMAQILENFLLNEPSAVAPSYKEAKKAEERVNDISSISQKKDQSVNDISKQSVKSNQQQQKDLYGQKDDTEKHLEKANRMLEEQKHEELSGFKFPSENKNVNQQQQPSYSQQKSNKTNDFDEDYNDGFEEEIEEELPEDNHLLDSNENFNPHRVTESQGGITVSQSLGVDPSVDSLALEDYDHIEPVERLI